MPNGMRFDNNAIRALPLTMQEQVAVKYAAELAKAARVAGPEKYGEYLVKHRIVPVKRLCFPSSFELQHYLMLRDAARECVISDIQCEEYDGMIWAVSYVIQWGGEFIPTGVPIGTLMNWARIGKNRRVKDSFCVNGGRRVVHEEKETTSETEAGAVSEQ